MHSAFRVLRRVLIRGVGIVLAAVVVVLAAAMWLLYSEHGRAQLVERALPLLNDILPGTVYVDHIADLGLGAVELRGVRIDDPTGAQVIAVERVRAELSPWNALHGEILVNDVFVSGADVDLRQIGETRRGLVSAFVDPDSPASPPSGTPPPHVRVLHAALTRGNVRLLELPALGQVDLKGIEIEGAYELRDGESIVDLKHLGVAFERAGESLGRLEHAAGRLPAEPEPMSVSLKAELLQSQVVLAARGPAPWRADAQHSALDVKLELRDVLLPRVAAKLVPPIELPEVPEAVSATLALQGSARNLQVQLALQTAGGSAKLAGSLREYAHAKWILESAELAPARVVSGLSLPQPFVVGARLAGTIDLGTDGSIATSLDADTRLNGQRLPRAAGKARIHEGALHDVRLTLADAHSKIALDGELAADRSLRAALRLNVDARSVRETLSALNLTAPEAHGTIAGQLQIEHAATTRVWGHIEGAEFDAGPLSLREFAVNADLRGRVPALSGSAQVELKSGKFSNLELRDVSVSIAGRPNHYTLATAATLPERLSLALQLELSELSERAVSFSGSGHGQLAGEPWRLEILPTRAQTSGKLETKGVSVRVAGQELRAKGRWAEESALELHGRALDLTRLQALATRVAPEAMAGLPALHGLVSLEAALSGSVNRPRAEVKLQGDAVGSAGRPNVDVELSSSLDTSAGSGRLSARIEAADDAKLRATFEVQSQFARTNGWPAALIAGDHRLALELAHLDLDWLAAMSGVSLPLHGQVQGQLNAELGAQLRLDWRGSATVNSDTDPGKLALQHTLALDERGVHTGVRAGGSSDPVLVLDASLGVPLARDQLLSLVARARSLVTTQQWSVALDVPARDIRAFPLRSMVAPGTLPPIKVGLHTEIEHAPHAEPSVRLALRADQLEPFENDKSCKPGMLVSALDAELQAGRLTAKLRGAQERVQLLQAELSAGFSLAKLLAGERVKPTEVSLQTRVQGAELATLPFVCRRARGKVDLDLTVSEPFEDAPKARAKLALDRLTLANDTLNMRAEIEADAKSARLKAELQAAGKVSKLDASVPLRWSGGTIAIDEKREIAANAKLDALPVAPFVPTAIGISYPSGSLGGNVSVRGHITEPQVTGLVELNDVAFTLTDLAQPIDHVRGRIRLQGRSFAIEKLTATDKQGKLEITANATLKSREEATGKLRLVLDEFPVRKNGEVAATVDGDFSVTADVTRAMTHIKLKIDRFDTYLESIDTSRGIKLEPHPDLTVNGRPNTQLAAEATNSKPEKTDTPRRDLRVDIRSTRFWVKRDDFAMRLSADLSVQSKGPETRFTGEIAVERGYVDLLGKQFEINPNEGKLHFSGDSGTPDPIVKIKAHHDNRKTGDIIGVVIAGRSSAPELTFTVNDKKVDAGAAVAAIYGSQQYSPHAEKTASVQASAVLTGLTAGLVATAARREMGVLAPMLMIDPGDEESGARIRAGFEFDSLVPHALRDVITGVYVEGIVASEKNGASEGEQSSNNSLRPGALLELYFPYNLFTAGQYGPGTTWSLDVGWQL